MNNVTLPSEDSPSKLTEWKNEPSVEELKRNLTDAKTETDNHVQAVDAWLDNLYIKGSAKLPKVKNRSSIQPKLIRKQAEWRYSSLSEPFLSTPDVFNVSPVTFEDRKASQQNELVLNHQFNHQLNKVEFIDEYIRTAVDEGTVIVRTGWEEEVREVEVEVPVFEETVNTSPEFTAQLQMAMQMMSANPDQFKQQVPEELQRSVGRSMETQRPIQVIQTGTRTETQRKTVKNQPTADIVDYRDIIIDPSCKGNADRAKFAIYKFTTSLEELRAAGLYKNLDNINITGNSPLADADSEEPDNTNFNFQDKPRKRFTAYEYWGYWDIDGTGLVKPFVATWVGDTLIRMDENPYPDQKIPFVIVPYLPVRRSLYGQPDGELTKDNQDVVGAVTRGMIDILASSANGQRGYQRGALDLTNKRRFEQGKDYEFNGGYDPRTAFHTGSFPEIPASAQFMFQSMNQEAESLTGIKAFTGGISGQALGDTATGIRGALDASAKRELGILRRLADGIVQIGKKFISMNSEFLQDEEIIRVTNDEFVAINRDELAGEFDLRLSISTAEEDNQKAQELAFMLQTTAQSSDPNEVRMIRAEIARLRKMPDLAKKIEEFQPQPDPLAQRKAELEIELLEAQIAETIAESQQRAATAQLNQAKAGEAQSKTDLNELDFVEQESGVKQERDLQKQGEQAKANAKLEMVKQALSSDSPQPA